MFWGCFPVSGTGALHKVDGKMKKKTTCKFFTFTSDQQTAGQLKHGDNWVIKQDNDCKHKSKMALDWIKLTLSVWNKF